MSTNNRPKEENRKRVTAREQAEEFRADRESSLTSPKQREAETKRTDRNRDPEIEGAGEVAPMDPRV
jgi:hypothetical protein